jgi:carboxyl-terminal processing protease
MNAHHIATVSLFIVMLLNPGMANGQSSGNVCGIGVVVAPDAPAGSPTHEAVIADHINVVRVYSGSPADISGLQNGDDIIAINGSSIVGMKFLDVVNNVIRGEEGTSVKITVKRNGSANPLSFTVIRGPVRVEP